LLRHGDEVLWESENNKNIIEQQFILGRSYKPLFTIKSNNNTVSKNIDAAIVANSPHRHSIDATAALDLGASVLVEKPLSLDLASTESLVELASLRAKTLGIGLTFLLLPIFSYARAWLQSRTVRRIAIRWFDPSIESRGGETKTADLTVHKVHDLFPHHWSILQALMPGRTATSFHAKAGPEGSVEAKFLWGDLDISLYFGRRGEYRERHVAIELDDDGLAEIDFALEPGVFRVDGAARPFAFDPHAARPLTAELRGFLDAVADPAANVSWPLHAHRCIGSVAGAVALHDRVAAAEAEALATLLAEGKGGANRDVAALLVDNLGPELAGRRRLTFADDAAVGDLVVDGLSAIRGGQASAAVSQSRWIASVRALLRA
jgi:predicted dehydrogenase